MRDTNILTLALRLSQRAGALIREQRRQLDISFKGGGTELVTQADVAADKLITQGILACYPDHLILSEELNPGQTTDAEHLWIIDPIDGTVNYAHRHPQCAVSIAYYHQGKPVVGVVHNPFLNETFHAIRSKGAFLNDRPIRVSRTDEMHRALIATGFPYTKETLPLLMRRLSAILGQCADVRRLGSAALDICWVATGRLDGYYESVSPWDFAAARLIASEAGAATGHIFDLNEGDNADLVGANLLISTPALFEGLQQILQVAEAEPS